MKIKNDTNEILHIENFDLYIEMICWSCSILVLARIGHLFANRPLKPEDTFLFVSFLLFLFGGAVFSRKESFIIKKKKNNSLVLQRFIQIKTRDNPFQRTSDVIIEKTYNDAGESGNNLYAIMRNINA